MTKIPNTCVYCRLNNALHSPSLSSSACLSVSLPVGYISCGDLAAAVIAATATFCGPNKIIIILSLTGNVRELQRRLTEQDVDLSVCQSVAWFISHLYLCCCLPAVGTIAGTGNTCSILFARHLQLRNFTLIYAVHQQANCAAWELAKRMHKLHVITAVIQTKVKLRKA